MELINSALDYIKELLSFNLNVSGTMAAIASDGLLVYLVMRRIRGFGYRLKTALIVAGLLAVIFYLLFIYIYNVNMQGIIPKLF